MSGKPLPRHPVTQPPDPSYCLIPLTQGQNAIVDAEDYERLAKRIWFAHWDSHTNGFYAHSNTKVNGKQFTTAMHREVLRYNGEQQIDHRNRNSLDNRKQNLRHCTQSDNVKNAKVRSDNKSGFKGVSFEHKIGKWRAQIQSSNKKIWLGYFYTPAEAAYAYDEAAKKYHGEFAMLNHQEIAPASTPNGLGSR